MSDARKAACAIAQPPICNRAANSSAAWLSIPHESDLAPREFSASLCAPPRVRFVQLSATRNQILRSASFLADCAFRCTSFAIRRYSSSAIERFAWKNPAGDCRPDGEGGKRRWRRSEGFALRKCPSASKSVAPGSGKCFFKAGCTQIPR